MKLDADTWNMLDYFWSSYGDLTRWCGWVEFAAKNPNHPIVADGLSSNDIHEGKT